MSYTPQLSDPLRVNIGKMLIVHEIGKLLPDLDRDLIESQVNKKLADLHEIVSIRDFWNLTDSFMLGYKLKNIAKEITSQAYTWALVTDQSLDDLRFSTDINGLQTNTNSVQDIKAFFEANPNELQRIIGDTQKEFPKEGKRHFDPIIVFAQDTNFFVHDGNGRLLKAIIEGQDVIKTYVGTRNNTSKSNHWVSTSYLQRLVDEKCIELLIKTLLESDNAILEFENRVIIGEDFKQSILKEIKQ